jgi:hypothetical protein
MLFSRFPGNKRNYSIYDGRNYAAVIEPFGGSATFSQQMMARGTKNVFLADADPSVFAVYKTWMTPACHKDFYLEMKTLKKYFAREPEMAFLCVKTILDNFKDQSIPLLAAASLVFRHVIFGGIVRRSANGKLNVVCCKERLPTLNRWEYTLPPIAADCNICLETKWQWLLDYFDKWAASNDLPTIALVDPPYYADRIAGQPAMTAAYPGHKPHCPETLRLSIDPVKVLLKYPQIKRIVVTNYVSPALKREMLALSEEFAVPMKFTALGKMDSINRGMGSKSQNFEGVWEFGVAHQEQPSLF